MFEVAEPYEKSKMILCNIHEFHAQILEKKPSFPKTLRGQHCIKIMKNNLMDFFTMLWHQRVIVCCCRDAKAEMGTPCSNVALHGADTSLRPEVELTCTSPSG